jgi:hypothetical protein
VGRVTTDMLPIDAFPATAVDQATADLLKLVSGDTVHEGDRRRIVEAVVAEAASAGGTVNPNRLRARLSDDHGNLVVYPRVLGAVVRALTVKGALAWAGWDVCSGSTSGNNGKPLRVYTLANPAAAS